MDSKIESSGRVSARKYSVYSASIEASRGLAAFSVMIFHTYLWIMAPSVNSAFDGHLRELVRQPMALLLNVLFGYGFLGVNAFFVISGFCIHLPNVDREALSLKTFALRRFVRLYPLYIFVCAVVFALSGPVMGKYTEKGVDTWNIIGHIFLWHYFGPPKSAGMGVSVVLWTIALEAQFYILYAAGFGLIRRLGLQRVMLAFLVAEFIYRVAWIAWPNSLVHLHMVFTPSRFSPLRFGEWLLGAYLAECYADRRIAYRPIADVASGCLLIIVGILGGAAAGFDKYTSTDLPASIGFFFVLRGVLAWETKRAPATNPAPLLEWLGERCYSTYLTHATVILSVSTAIPVLERRLHFSDTALRIAAVPVATSAALAVAALAYRYVERPSHQLARRLVTRTDLAFRRSSFESATYSASE